MKNIRKFNEFKINEGLGDIFKGSFKEKALNFYEKVKHLFSEIQVNLTDTQREKIENASTIREMANVATKDVYNQIHSIVEENKEEVKSAYNEAFGVNEEICILTLLSLICTGLFLWSLFGRRSLNRFVRKTKRGFSNMKKSCSSGSCSTSSKSCTSVDDVLDKVAKKGMKSLTEEEKRILYNAGGRQMRN